jgi:hypothetical protein
MQGMVLKYLVFSSKTAAVFPLEDRLQLAGTAKYELPSTNYPDAIPVILAIRSRRQPQWT